MSNEGTSDDNAVPEPQPEPMRTKRILRIWAAGPGLKTVRDFLDEEAFKAVQTEEEASGAVGHITGQDIDQRSVSFRDEGKLWRGSVIIEWEDKH